MTDVDDIRLREWDDGRAEEADPVSASVDRRRHVAPPAHPFWRFGFPALVAAAAVAVALLSAQGAKEVLDSTDGAVVETVSDPSAPGFVAFVDPTPTMVVAHTQSGELVGVTVLARTQLDRGGTAILVHPLLRSDSGPTLHARYAEGGLAALEAEVGALFAIGFTEADEISTARLGAWMDEVEPIPFALPDDLIELDANGVASVWLAAGTHDLDGSVAGKLYGASNPDEVTANRTERQLDLWQSWMIELGRAEDLVAATLPFDEGLSVHLRSLAQSADMRVLAASPVTFGGADTEYELNDNQRAALGDLIKRAVPLPVSPVTADWPAARLLDGTGNSATLDAAVRELAHSGFEIAVIGNAIEFGVKDTVVAYHRESDEAIAQQVAESLGASVAFAPEPDQPTAITITIGSDWKPA